MATTLSALTVTNLRVLEKITDLGDLEIDGNVTLDAVTVNNLTVNETTTTNDLQVDNDATVTGQVTCGKIDAQTYLINGDGGVAGNVLTSLGALGTGWYDPSTTFSINYSIPITGFTTNYFVGVLAGSTIPAWQSSTTVNGLTGSLSNGGSMGTINFQILPGNYRVQITYVKAANVGITELYFDGVLFNSFDGYTAGSDVVTYTNTITFSGSTAHTMEMKNNGKNASSSSYNIILAAPIIQIIKII